MYKFFVGTFIKHINIFHRKVNQGKKSGADFKAHCLILANLVEKGWLTDQEVFSFQGPRINLVLQNCQLYFYSKLFAVSRWESCCRSCPAMKCITVAVAGGEMFVRRSECPNYQNQKICLYFSESLHSGSGNL